MDLQKLTQYNEKLFFKYLGHYIAQKRQQFKLSLSELFENNELFDAYKLKSIESGELMLSQIEFDDIVDFFELDPSELLNIAKLTQVNYILELHSEIDGASST